MIEIKYKAKPVVVNAWHFTADNFNSRPKWVIQAEMTGVLTITLNPDKESYITFKNGVRVPLNNYIIKDNRGHFFDVDMTSFDEKFEAI